MMEQFVNKQMERDANEVYVTGWIEEELEYSHEISGEIFYKTKMKVARKSGTNDELLLVIPMRTLRKSSNMDLSGKYVKVSGEIRSYDTVSSDGKMHLEIFVFVKYIQRCMKEEVAEDYNYIYLEGNICRKPIFRFTPMRRQICDILLKVSRRYNKISYIPCIAWGVDAYNLSQLQAGSRIKFMGRIQSRQYTKRNPFTGEEEIRTTYEVSIVRVSE